MNVKYLSQSANGNFQYRRVIPKEYRNLFGGRTEVKRALGPNEEKALREYAEINADYQRTLDEATRDQNISERELALEILRKKGASQAEIDQIAAEDVREGSGLDQALDEVVSELVLRFRQEEEKHSKHKVPEGVIESLAAGKLPDIKFTLSSALTFYSDEKATGIQATDRQFNNGVERVKKRLIDALGSYNVNVRPLQKFSRVEARQFRDELLKHLSPNSVKRNLQILSAALNKTIEENDLNCRNPVRKLEVKGAGTSREQRLPLTDEDMAMILDVMVRSNDDVLGAIWVVLRDTGARLREICNLRACDVNVQESYAHIRPHEGYELKTRNSQRIIPLSPEALRLIQVHRIGLDDQDLVFRRYAGPRKSEKASAALMKRLRTMIKERRKSVHSLRHRMKDLLRNSGCPESLSREILGHSDQSVAANYGSGTALEVKRKALEKVWV